MEFWCPKSCYLHRTGWLILQQCKHCRDDYTLYIMELDDSEKKNERQTWPNQYSIQPASCFRIVKRACNCALKFTNVQIALWMLSVYQRPRLLVTVMQIVSGCWRSTCWARSCMLIVRRRLTFTHTLVALQRPIPMKFNNMKLTSS